jgi:hypothetical protein
VAKEHNILEQGNSDLYCRGSKKVQALDTWKSLEFNLDVGSITLCLVPQLFMLELMAASCLPATTGEDSTFLFFYFSCLLHVGGGQGTLPVLVKNVMNVNPLCFLYQTLQFQT